MSYYEQQPQNGQRPGFSEAPTNFATSGGFSQSIPPQQPQQSSYAQQPQSQPQQPTSYSNSGGSSSGGGGGYGGGQRGGYSGGQSNGGWKGNSGGGGGGGWKGNGGGGGGWKGGGGGGFKGKPPLTPEQLIAMKMPKSIVMAGNFRAPEQLIPVIREIAEMIHQHGFALRASAMDGFDKLVLDNVQNLEIHLPWKDFNQVGQCESSFNSDECKEFAKRYMPDWGNLKDSHQAFFCKNVRLVLGKSLKQPCQLAIIWSEDGVEGPANRTAQSMHAGHIAAMCKDMRIPVINISNPDAVHRVRRFLEG